MKSFQVTYNVLGKITLAVKAPCLESVLIHADNQISPSQINWHGFMRLIDMQPVSIEDEFGNVTYV